MDRVKTLAKYVIWIVLFWIFSDVLIYVGSNSIYKNLECKGTVPEGIQIEQIQATKVNGRVKLIVTNKEYENKFLKIDLYSQHDVCLGTQYIEIGKVEENNYRYIEKYFNISDVKSYEMSVVDELGESTEGFVDTAMSAITIILFVIKYLII